MLLAEDLRYVMGFKAADPGQDGGNSDRRNQDFITLVRPGGTVPRPLSVHGE